MEKLNVRINKQTKYSQTHCYYNGRQWALGKGKGKNRVYGHNQGVKSVRDTVEGAVELGINFLTLFAFSTENWKRPKAEVNALMSLLVKSINNRRMRFEAIQKVSNK